MDTVLWYKRHLMAVIIIIACSIITVFLTTQESYAATEIGKGSCGKNTTWTLYDDKTLIIQGTGGIDSDSSFKKKSFSKVIIKPGVTSIGEDAFYNCNSLESIVIPEGIKKIEMFTFYHCINLTSVSLPSSLTEIDLAAFEDCWSLKSIVIPKNVKDIWDSAFYDCVKLKTIQFKGTKLEYIDEDAFYNTPKKIKLICAKRVRKKYKRMLIRGGARYYKIKVRFNANGGKVKKKSMKVYPYHKYGKLPTPKRKNYAFAGWYTKKKGGYREKSSDPVEYYKSRTLYAHWKRPKLNFGCSIYDYDTRHKTISVALENGSKHSVKVLPYGAKIIDYDYTSYDRRLRRSTSVKVGYKKDKVIKFKIVGRNTWPGTARKTMYFYVMFCGKKYKVKCDDFLMSRYKSGSKWKDTFDHNDERWEGFY